MEISYTRIGDYLLPNIILKTERDVNGEPVRLGRYGMLHKEYLRREKPALYAQLLLSERLYPLSAEVDEATATRLTAIDDREIAHEVILSELVYV
jgi:hypothetical protein